MFYQIRANSPWANSVDPDTSTNKLVGKRSNHTDLSSLSHGVIEQRRRPGVGDLRSSHDDRASLADVRDGGTSQEECSLDVEVDGVVLRGISFSFDGESF